MKIAQVVVTAPPDVGGMGRVAAQESEILTKFGNKVTLFALKHQQEYQENSSFNVVRLNSMVRQGDAGFVPNLLKKLKSFDLVHLHWPFYGGAEWVLLAKLMYGVPYVITYHMDANPRRFSGRFIKGIYDFIWTRLLIKNADQVFTVDKDHWQNSSWTNKIEAIELSNAVDEQLFTPGTPNKELQKKLEVENKKVVLFVGNPLPFKRLDFLINAFAKLNTQDAVLVIISRGKGLNKYISLVKELTLEDKVRFVRKQISDLELREYYRLAHCLVVPSLGSAESFSLVSIEAMACGCPVVMSNSHGIRKRINTGVDGFLFESNSLENLTQRLKEVLALRYEKLQEMKKSARNKVVSEYGLNVHGKKLLDFYKNLLSV